MVGRLFKVISSQKANNFKSRYGKPDLLLSFVSLLKNNRLTFNVDDHDGYDVNVLSGDSRSVLADSEDDFHVEHIRRDGNRSDWCHASMSGVFHCSTEFCCNFAYRSIPHIHFPIAPGN